MVQLVLQGILPSLCSAMVPSISLLGVFSISIMEITTDSFQTFLLVDKHQVRGSHEGCDELSLLHHRGESVKAIDLRRSEGIFRGRK
jgi:hypothetical protein